MAGFNLGILMRHWLGAGTPKGLAALRTPAFGFHAALRRLRRTIASFKLSNRHDYHLRDWIVVEDCDDVATPATPRTATGTVAPPPQDGQDGLNHRQRWFSDQLHAGRTLRRRDLEEQFGVAERTAKRDIAALTRAGVVVFEQAHGANCYRLARLS